MEFPDSFFSAFPHNVYLFPGVGDKAKSSYYCYFSRVKTHRWSVLRWTNCNYNMKCLGRLEVDEKMNWDFWGTGSGKQHIILDIKHLTKGKTQAIYNLLRGTNVKITIKRCIAWTKLPQKKDQIYCTSYLNLTPWTGFRHVEQVLGELPPRGEAAAGESSRERV